jgi:hypothetical protein
LKNLVNASRVFEDVCVPRELVCLPIGNDERAPCLKEGRSHSLWVAASDVESELQVACLP